MQKLQYFISFVNSCNSINNTHATLFAFRPQLLLGHPGQPVHDLVLIPAEWPVWHHIPHGNTVLNQAVCMHRFRRFTDEDLGSEWIIIWLQVGWMNWCSHVNRHETLIIIIAELSLESGIAEYSRQTMGSVHVRPGLGLHPPPLRLPRYTCPQQSG